MSGPPYPSHPDDDLPSVSDLAYDAADEEPDPFDPFAGDEDTPEAYSE
jgi:hypothetical protein